MDTPDTTHPDPVHGAWHNFGERLTPMRNAAAAGQRPATSTPLPLDTTQRVRIKDRHLLRTLREAAHLSQSDLADRAGIGRQAVGHWETGRTTRLSPGTARLVAEALGVKPKLLFAKDGGTSHAGPGRRGATGLGAPAACAHPTTAT